MKKIIIVILISFFLNSSKAQDTLTMRNGENIPVKVIEVGTLEVKYKKLDNLNGPDFSILKSELSMIQYENGSKEVFKEDIKINQESIAKSRSKDVSEIITKIKRVKLIIFAIGALEMLYLTFNH